MSAEQVIDLLMWDLRLSKPAKLIDHSASFGSVIIPTAVAWQPSSQHSVAVGMECGQVALIDMRNTSEKSPCTHPHSRTVTRVAFNAAHPSYVAATSEDCSVSMTNFSIELPDPNDIAIFAQFMQKKMEQARKPCSYDEFRDMQHDVLARMIVFNRRLPGEVQALK